MKKVFLILILLGAGVFSIAILKAISQHKCEQQVEAAINISTEKTTEAYEAGAQATSEGGAVNLSDGTNVRVHSFYDASDSSSGVPQMDLNLPSGVLTVKKGDTFEVNGYIYSVYDVYPYSEVDESCHITGPGGGIAILEL